MINVTKHHSSTSLSSRAAGKNHNRNQTPKPGIKEKNKSEYKKANLIIKN